MPSVTIDQNYFKKSLNDYSDFKWALVRELGQNTLDCGSNNWHVDVSYNGKSVVLTSSNDGRPMDYKTITEKLLSIGGTTKEGSCDGGEVGGFGIASVVIYMAQDGYTIHSGEWLVEGHGGEYEIKETSNRFDGTKSVITIHSNRPERLAQEIADQFVRFASFAQWRGRIHLTHDDRTRNIGCTLHKGYFRKEFDFGRLYTNKAYNGLLIFRINGIPMFTKSIAYEGCAIFEANKGSIELMTSNRDSLKYTYQWEIDDVIKRFSTNRSSVLNKSPVYEVYGNTLMGVEKPQEKPQAAPEATEVPAAPKGQGEAKEGVQQFADAAARMAQADPGLIEPVDMDDDDQTFILNRGGEKNPVADRIASDDDRRPFQYTRKFMILNESGMTTPEYVRPDKMSSYCKKLLNIWTNLMCTTYQVNKASGNFAVGFCLGEAIAKHVNKDGITYYLINPFEIVEQAASHSRSFKRKYHLVQDREDMVMSSVHEFIHGALGHSYHDEQFSSILTKLAGVAMKNHKEYKKCFRTS